MAFNFIIFEGLHRSTFFTLIEFIFSFLNFIEHFFMKKKCFIECIFLISILNTNKTRNKRDSERQVNQNVK